MQPFDTTGRRVPLPRARYEAPEAWKDADQKLLLQFLKTPPDTKSLLTLHDVAANRALSAQGSWGWRPMWRAMVDSHTLMRKLR